MQIKIITTLKSHNIIFSLHRELFLVITIVKSKL